MKAKRPKGLGLRWENMLYCMGWIRTALCKQPSRFLSLVLNSEYLKAVHPYTQSPNRRLIDSPLCVRLLSAMVALISMVTNFAQES